MNDTERAIYLQRRGDELRASDDLIVFEIDGHDDLPTPPLPMPPTEARAKHENAKRAEQS